MSFLSYFTVFIGALVIRLSYQIDCTSQNVAFTPDFQEFTITSDNTDTTPKTCKYLFTVPKFYVPTITVLALTLTGDNKITAGQYSEYGGAKSYQFTQPAFVQLAPVNFTLEIALPTKTVNDRFKITISVKDATPFRTGLSFMVKPDLGELIDWDMVLGNSSTVQKFDNDHPLSIFSIRVALFSDFPTVDRSLQAIHVYDVGLYKGSLYDIVMSQNTTQVCTGTQFAIVNTNSGVVPMYSILISLPYYWNSQVNIIPAQLNSTNVYSATNGLTVFHEINSDFMGTTTPSIYSKISFRGNSTLQVYAGCVTQPSENRRIATITPSNAASYEQLMVFGRCRTYVLSQGVFQWHREDTYFTNFKHQIGRKGVIMSDNYPYEFTGNTTTRNYLIQAPNNNENIIVEYEVAGMAVNTVFNIKQEEKAGKESYQSLTSSSGNYTSPSTYQQYIDYTVPKGSTGLLVRYTVLSSAGDVSFWMIMIALFLGYSTV